jgi:hypothetical protein
MKTAFRLPIAAFGLVIFNAANFAAQAQFTYTTNYNGTLNLSHYTDTSPVVTVPSSNDGLAVTSIGYGAFADLAFLTSVSIPDTIVRIIGGTFAGCPSLTNVTLGSGITSIGDYTFQSCTGLPRITIPASVTSIGNFAFDNCWKLTDVTLPNSVASIADNAFSYCSSLTSITIPASVTAMGNNVFYACPKLTSVYFQGNAPSPGSGVFTRDHSVTVYCLPGTTGWDAFAQATGLTPVLWQPQVQLSIAGVVAGSGLFSFTINGTGNLTIVIEASTSLANPNWVPVATNNLSAGSATFSDPQWKNYPVRFYRVQSQ